MKNFKTRIIYFGAIAAVSLAFFALQLYVFLTSPDGTGSIVLLILWGIMVAFGIAGIIFTMAKKNRHPK
jgi:heme/copper-type cytochrome/quinol oxidase subunit 4